MSDEEWGGLGDHYEYDEYDFNDNNSLEFGRFWQGKDKLYEVSKMSDRHINNVIRLCEKLSQCETFENEANKWNEWVDIFEMELASRTEVILDTKCSKSIRGSNGNGRPMCRTIKKAVKDGLIVSGMVKMKCHCDKKYEAKAADLKRGWALSCSKRCASIRRDFGRPAAKVVVKCGG